MKRDWSDLGTPAKGVGDPIVLQLGEQTRIRIVEPGYEEWLQHDIEGEDAEGRPLYRSVACSQTLECPLCAKGRKHFPVKQRYAVNVLDSNGDVRVLIGGSTIFKSFGNDSKHGFDVMDYEYIISKNGKGMQTTYDVVRMEKSSRELPDASKLHDLSRYSDPMTPEGVFALLDEVGIDYDSLEIPVLTKAQAMKVPVPFGKYSERKTGGVGLTIGELVAEDLNYATWMKQSMESKGNIADEAYIALKMLTEGGSGSKPMTVEERVKAEGFRDVEVPDDVAPDPDVAQSAQQENGEALVCTVCGFRARTPSGLSLHMKSKHPEGAGPAEEPEPEKEEPTEEPEPEKDEQAEAPAAAGEMSRQELITACKNIFLEDKDGLYKDFDKIGDTIERIKKGSRVLTDLSDAQLAKLYKFITM